MSEYIAGREATSKFLVANLGKLLRRSGKSEGDLSESLNTDSKTISRWCRGVVPSNPNALLRLYAVASARERDYAKLRNKIVKVSDEELQTIKANNHPPTKPILSNGAFRGKTRLRFFGDALVDGNPQYVLRKRVYVIWHRRRG